jgi:hypothetical protein
MPTYTISSWRSYMPDLENLKKQAKLILRWHRERHYPVAAQIRALMPRFLNMPDSEILAASFKGSAMRKKWWHDSTASIVGKP